MRISTVNCCYEPYTTKTPTTDEAFGTAMEGLMSFPGTQILVQGQNSLYTSVNQCTLSSDLSGKMTPVVTTYMVLGLYSTPQNLFAIDMNTAKSFNTSCKQKT